jgi:transcriptional regulator PpsR
MTMRPSLTGLDPSITARLLEHAGDVVILLDAAGCVLDVTARGGALARAPLASWRGRALSDLVTQESRDKVRVSLDDALAGAQPKWRQVNHPVDGGEDLPVLYLTVSSGPDAVDAVRFVVLGRDLHGTVALQRRLVDAQQTMERDYWRYREADTRYRHLMQTSQDALLVIDGQNQRIVETNPAADALLARQRGVLAGAVLPTLFAEASAEPLQSLLAAARTVGRRDPAYLTLAEGGIAVAVSATLFRQDQMPFLLVRVMPQPASVVSTGRASEASLHGAYFGQASDALVYTDAQGRVLAVNRSFALMAQLSAEEQARGEMLDRWLGRTGVELSVLITNLRQRGAVGLFNTTLRGEFGAAIDVEISASVLAMPDAQRLAFSIRDVSRRLQSEERAPDRVSRSVGELTELVGRVPLKDIVSETTDLIEQLCIEAALQMTQGNRASAAQLLGLSRQSLYVKLNRFGLAAGAAATEPDEERPGSSVKLD